MNNSHLTTLHRALWFSLPAAAMFSLPVGIWVQSRWIPGVKVMAWLGTLPDKAVAAALLLAGMLTFLSSWIACGFGGKGTEQINRRALLICFNLTAMICALLVFTAGLAGWISNFD